MDNPNQGTFKTFNMGEANPFVTIDNKTSFGSCSAVGGENPFFNLSKPIVVTSSSGKGFNIFGGNSRPQTNNTNIIIDNRPDNVPTFETKVSAITESGAKNPFFSDINLQKNPLSFAHSTVTTFKSSLTTNVKGKDPDTLPNPFFDNSVHVESLLPVSSQPVEEKRGVELSDVNSGNLGFTRESAFNNPFMSTVTVPPIDPVSSNSATIHSQTSGIKCRNSPFFTSVAPYESNNNLNIFSRIPQKIGVKKTRRSFDKLKPSLSLLAENLRSVVCADSESKYDVLEKIDKAIRKGVKSNFHIQDGKRYRALKGTCVDMCPEKERYFRDDKHQISPFELNSVQDIVSTLDGNYPQLDHCKAVKEYSRSSADQEEPLPHQLRPASVLNYTMDYLVMKIMDVKYSKRTDWFDFLWNRTRAIRKDITQQNLCCKETISVIEKCARFHIFSSHYLCEQELHVFDPKMNLENLTKCLQTLKHMYEDKWKENKEANANESEFRCYQILLNLNDGDMLREVMHFREDIRVSMPVKFALKVFSAIHDNNYVRFFKLVKTSTFLNACLLRPYFNQIRDLALRTMIRTFSQPNMDVPYPLANLQTILAFDNIDEAAEFCHEYGLSAHDSNVYFNRSSFSKPEEPFPPKMSIVVTDKLQFSMSEIVNNGPFQYHLDVNEPINSFSNMGTYIGNYHMLDDDTLNESIIEEIKSEKITVIEISDDSPVSPITKITSESEYVDDDEEEVPKVRNQVDEENIKNNDLIDQEFEDLRATIFSHVDDPDYVLSEDVDGEFDDDEYTVNSEYVDEVHVMFLREDYVAYIDELLSEEISYFTQSLFSTVIAEVKDELIQSEAMTNQELAIICIEEARTAVAEVIDEEQLKLEDEKQQMIKYESVEFGNKLLEENVMYVLNSICVNVYKDEINILESNVLTDEIKKQGVTILNNAMNKEMISIASDVITETSLNRAIVLESNKQTIFKKKLCIMFHRWIKAYKQQQFIKTSLIDFPPLPPLITTKEAVQKLHPDGDISYSLPNFSDNVHKRIQPKIKETEKKSEGTLDNNIPKEKSSKPLFSIIEDGMSLLFFKVFHEHCLYCESLLLPIAEPNDIIKFYNNTLVAIKDSLKLNFEEKHEEQLDNLISILKLPFLVEIDPYNWNLSCSECEEFISNVSDKNSAILPSRINNILDRYILRSSENEDILFPWSEIIEACIFTKMSSMYLEKWNVDLIGFQSVVYCEPDFITSLHVVNPLKEHIKTKRTNCFALQNSLTYKDEMRRNKFTREYTLRKSLDTVGSELDQLEASIRKSNINDMHSTSLQDIFNQSTSLLQNVEFIKENNSCSRRSFSTSCLDLALSEEKENSPSKFFPYDKQSGCKRSFEHSMMECLKDIDDYRMKLKTREEYWREIIDQ